MSKTALERLVEIDKDLRKFGFEWPDFDMILWQIESESAEIKEAIENRPLA